MHHSYEGCSNMAFLSPSNDSRVNLLLLLADLRAAKFNTPLARSPAPSADPPLFLWAQLVDRLGSPADQAALKVSGTGAERSSLPCPGTLPPDDSFVHAMAADNTFKPNQRDALFAARVHTQSGCNAEAAEEAIKSAQKLTSGMPTEAYALYLEGAAAFWRSDFDKAATAFASLQGAKPAWVRETATYMTARSLLNRAQVGAFDQYGSFTRDWHADPDTVGQAEAALDKYLQQYPDGAYTLSARGLKRRGYWLAHDTARLEEEYGALLLLPPDQRNLSDVELVQEIDNKVANPLDTDGTTRNSASDDRLLQATHNPLLLAMLDLQAMRTPETGAGQADLGTRHDDPLPVTTLQAQKPFFAQAMPLFEYLLAVHAFYVDNQPAEALRLLPDAARQSSFNYLQFSRQILRGMALEAQKDRNALGFWTQMLPGAKAPYEGPALQLAIAWHEERAGEIRNVFAPASSVRYPYLREILLAHVADATLLRTQAQNTSAAPRERDIALFTLLYKEATSGKAADFLKDLALVPPNASVDGDFALDAPSESYYVPEGSQPPSAIPLGIFLHDKTDTTNAGFGCPGLRSTELQLTRDPDNPTAQLCLADFLRLNPSVTYLMESTSRADELGGTPSLFPGSNFVRMDVYTAVLADPKSSRNDKAFALFRAVNCYASSGYNHCGGKDVPKAQRKLWFTTLKKDYAGTRWANELQYYW